MTGEWKGWDGLDLLRELCEAFGVSGFEREVSELIRARVTPLSDQLHVDPLGNLHAILNPDAQFTLMLDAHMDEIGFVVKGIEEGGFLRLAPVGGWDVRILPAQTIWVRGSDGQCHTGVVGSIPPHVQGEEERKRVFEWKDLFVDVGARDASELAKMKIRVGSPAVLPQPLTLLGDGSILGKALDNRVGCVVLIRLLEALARDRPQMRLVAIFSTTEEVGFRGAQVAARRWAPQMALILEGTTATDTPGVRPDQMVASLGHGPALTAADRTLIVPEALLERIISLAEGLGIAWQIKTPMFGATDGGAIQVSAGGVLAAVVAVPCRYIHSPGCVMRVDDLVHTERLVEAFVRHAPRIYEEITVA